MYQLQIRLTGSGVTTYQIVRDEGIEPSSEFVFLLNDVVADGPASGIFGLGPAESDGLVVEVHDAWLARGARRLWNTQEIRQSQILVDAINIFGEFLRFFVLVFSSLTRSCSFGLML